MKVKELIDKLKGYEDFDVEFSFSEPDGSKWGMAYRNFSIDDIGDIGYSSRIISLEGEEK